MKPTLNPEQESLHKQAIDLCRRHREIEGQIIEVLQKIERTKLYLKLEVTSLFQYAVRFLNLSEPTAYTLISVARKCATTPELDHAIKNQSLSVSKAARILSVITRENSAELIAFAKANTMRSIDFEVARINPLAAARESARPISQDHVELKFTVTKSTFEKLRRAQAVLAQKQSQHANMAQTLSMILEDYLKRHDPVKKAERFLNGGKASHGLEFPVKKQQLCETESLERPTLPKPETKPNPSYQAKSQPTRVPLKASDKHQVFARDGGQCTYRDIRGQRCQNDKWLHIHHLRPISQGGSNDAENLTTLCSVHHDLVHQLSL